MADEPCRDFKPDHNGECLNCDGWFSAHPPDTRLAVADRTLPLLIEQARKWNAEADRYLAERDALQLRVDELEGEIAAVRAEQTAPRHHAQLAADVWQMIRALADPEVGTSMVLKRDEDFHAAALNLIEMACDSAAESQRIADGFPPKGAS